MSTALAEFDARIAQVSSVLSSVVGNSWSGEAATEFHAGWTEWLRSAAVTRAALADIANRLQMAQNGYEIVEGQVRNSARSSTVGTTAISTSSSAKGSA